MPYCKSIEQFQSTSSKLSVVRHLETVRFFGSCLSFLPSSSFVSDSLMDSVSFVPSYEGSSMFHNLALAFSLVVSFPFLWPSPLLSLLWLVLVHLLVPLR